MFDKKTFLSIVNEDGRLYGQVSQVGFDFDDLYADEFNPLEVLCDLLRMVLGYEMVSSHPSAIVNYFFKDTFRFHSFFQNEDYEDEIDIYNHERKTEEEIAPLFDPMYEKVVAIRSFIVAVNRVRECILSGQSISMAELELIKGLNQFKFTFEVEEFHGNEYLGVFFGGGVTPEIWQRYLEKTKVPIRFSYTCYSLEEVVFAVWHYLIFNDYTKFNKCHHCGRYFATKSLKQVYCERYTPYDSYGYLKNAYKKYGDLNCRLAVQRIKEQLVRRKGKVCDNLEMNYDSIVFDKFKAEYKLLKDAVDKHPSLENIKKLDLFLAIDEVQSTWYKPEYRLQSASEHIYA